jgi:hypothetical protein
MIADQAAQHAPDNIRRNARSRSSGSADGSSRQETSANHLGHLGVRAIAMATAQLLWVTGRKLWPPQNLPDPSPSLGPFPAGHPLMA